MADDDQKPPAWDDETKYDNPVAEEPERATVHDKDHPAEFPEEPTKYDSPVAEESVLAEGLVDDMEPSVPLQRIIGNRPRQSLDELAREFGESERELIESCLNETTPNENDTPEYRPSGETKDDHHLEEGDRAVPESEANSRFDRGQEIHPDIEPGQGSMFLLVGGRSFAEILLGRALEESQIELSYKDHEQVVQAISRAWALASADEMSAYSFVRLKKTPKAPVPEFTRLVGQHIGTHGTVYFAAHAEDLRLFGESVKIGLPLVEILLEVATGASTGLVGTLCDQIYTLFRCRKMGVNLSLEAGSILTVLKKAGRRYFIPKTVGLTIGQIRDALQKTTVGDMTDEEVLSILQNELQNIEVGSGKWKRMRSFVRRDDNLWFTDGV